MSFDFIFLIVMQNVVAAPSAVLEKMTLEAAIFGNNFQLKLPLPHLPEPDVALNSCMSCRVTVPVLFCK